MRLGTRRTRRASLLIAAAVVSCSRAAIAQTGVAPAIPSGSDASPTRLNTTNRDFPLIVALMEGDTSLGDVNIVVGADDSIRIETQSLLNALLPVLDPAVAANVTAQVAGRPQIPLDALAAADIVLSFDRAALTLNLSVSPGARARRTIDLRGGTRGAFGEYQRPATFSAYLNIRAALDYIHTGFDTGLFPPTVILDGAARFGGFVLEGEAAYFPRNGDVGFIRQGTRIVYDDLPRLARYTAGDLLPTGRGFQNTPPGVGLSILRSYTELEPLRNLRAGGSRTFTLTRPSTVETFVNNVSVQRQRLDPGVYDLNNFPLAQGNNDVRIVVQDDTGLRESIDFSLFYDRTLLRAGLSEFGAYGGIRARTGIGSRSYLEDEWFASGYYRRGFNDSFTAGANFQIDRRVRQAGIETVLATDIGIIGVDAAVSHMDNFGMGFAVNVGLQGYLGGGRANAQAINGFFEFRSRNFTGIGTLQPSNVYSILASLGYSRTIGQSGTLGVDAQYSRGRGTEPDIYVARAVYSRRISYSFSILAEVRYEHSRIENGPGARLALTYRFGSRSSARADYDSRNDRLRVGYQRYGGEGVGAYSATAVGEFGEDNAGISADLRYNANRSELGVAHTTTYDRNNTRISDQRTSIRAASSIAFADGVFAIGRPIYDSFAIMARHPSLRDHVVEARPTRDSYQARADAFGPGVVPNLSSYIDQTINYSVPTAPIGYDLGEGSARLLPPYRSGYLVIAGSAYSISVIGRLMDADGQPLSLVSGQATEVDGDGRSIVVFTNREGRFAMSGARAGRWRIRMNTVPETYYEVQVTNGENSLLRIGDLRPSSGATQP